MMSRDGQRQVYDTLRCEPQAERRKMVAAAEAKKKEM